MTVLHTGWLQRRPHLHSVLIPGGVALGWANPATNRHRGWHGCPIPRRKLKKWEVTGGGSLSQVFPAVVAHWGHLVRF